MSYRSVSRHESPRLPHALVVAIAVSAVGLVGFQCPPGSSPIARVGVCEVDITPISPSLADEYEAAFGGTAVVNHTDPVYLAGFGNDRQATGYNDRLWARGIVVDGLGGRIAIVALDLVGYFNAEIQTIRALVHPSSAVDYLVVHSTHQHEGPDTVGIWGPDAVTPGTDPGYLDFVNQSVADCVDSAASNLQPARIKFATTDSTGLSLGLDAEDDGEAIEAAEGGTAIWVSADLGVLQGPLDIDVLDPDTGLPAPRRTFRWAEVHGQQLAERVVAAIPSRPGRPFALIDFATTQPVPVRLDNPFFRFFIAIGVLPSDGLYTAGVPDDSVGFPYPPPFDVLPQALGDDLHTEVGAFRINEASFAVVPDELDPQIGETYRDRMAGAEHTFIIGLGNDEIGYQVPAAKWDDSCHTCAPFIMAGATAACPLYPNIDCNTVFQNNVGADVDPAISDALEPLLDGLHD